ncbi:hypothetical protein O181_071748, partial [Austropuccinia psidii MF-1]|nr:hypothetical protein [Austropuccinia psidii MF-1]
TGSRQRDVARWTNVGGPLPVGSRTIYYSSEVPISRINKEGVMKGIRKIADSPPNPDSEDSDELDETPEPYHPQYPQKPPAYSCHHSSCLKSSSKTIPHSTAQKLTHGQVFKCQDQWPIQATREDTNMESENQDAVARLFRRVGRNSREVIMYANDRAIPGTASEEMAAKFSWYEDELINEFQRTFDYLGIDN